MSGNSTVDRAAMQAAVQALDVAYTEVNGIQTRLTNEVQTLATGWVGRASDAFVQAHMAFNDRFNSFKNDLAHIKETMQVSTTAYTQAEDENTAATNQILGLL